MEKCVSLRFGALLKFTYTNGSIIPTKKTQYLFKDHLGSTDTVVTPNGNTDDVVKMSFGSFGERRNVNWDGHLTIAEIQTLDLSSTTDKGYTGHEQLDDVGLIHMNGRVYDPKLGRFMSADPNIQAPTDTQSLNRYSYVLNNPLSATDPSGYFFKKLLQKISRNPLLNAIASYYLGPLYNAAVTAANGGSFGDILKSYVIASAAHAAFGAYGGGDGFGAFLARGAIGGVVNVASGGKFGHGFASAGFGGLYGGNNIFVSAIIGGTISKLTGGKFANGAASAAFAVAMRLSQESSLKGDVEGLFDHLDESLRTEYLAEAKLQAIKYINKSEAFSTEVLREQYLALFEKTIIHIEIVPSVLPNGDVATSNFVTESIAVHKAFFNIYGRRHSGGSTRWEPKSLSIKRMARHLLHEIRHQTNVNHAMGTPRTRLKAQLDPSYYRKAPFEVDARRFSAIVSGNRKGSITDI